MQPHLNKQLHFLLSATALTPQKASLVLSFSDGRCESSKELTDVEANNLIGYLKNQKNLKADADNKMRRKIISMAHEMHWHLSGTQTIDMERLNHWCEKYSYLKKPLMGYSSDQLPTLVSQFQKVYKDYLVKF